MEIEEDYADFEDISAVPTSLRGDQFAYLVSGPSMNKKRLFDGDYVVCVDPWRQSRPPQSGDIVVVERTGLRGLERTVKELIINDGQYELWPRSDHPAFQSPIVVSPDDWREGDGTEVRIVGLVIQGVFRV